MYQLLRPVCWGLLGLALACMPRVQHPVRTAPLVMTDGTEHGEIHPWTCTETADPAQFSFAIMADNTGGARPGVFASAIRKLNHLRPDLVMCVGDLIEGYTQDSTELDRQWDALAAQTGQLSTRLYYVAGNHDLSNKTQYDRYCGRFGRPYYHFMHGGVLFLVLATSDSGRIKPGELGMGAEQVAYFRAVLDKNPHPRWTFVFMHNPLWDNEDKARAGRWTELEAMLAGRNYTVFAGHYHQYRREVRRGMQYYVLATTGGASGLKGLADGTFDHIAWVTLAPQGPQVANLMLDGIHSDDPGVDARWESVMRCAHRDSLLDVTVAHPANHTLAATTAQMNVVNPDSLALAFKLAFKPHPQVQVTPAVIDTVLPPRAAAEFAMTLTADPPVPLIALEPVNYSWSVSAGRPEQGYSYSQDGMLGLYDPYHCPRHQGKPVVIDGKLDEWPVLPQRCPDPAGPPVAMPENRRDDADGSFSFALEYDDSCLYLALQVLDDSIFLDSTQNSWEQDGVEIRMIALPEPARSKATNSWHCWLVPSSRPGAAGTWAMAWPQDKQVALVTTDKGYSFELAIPLRLVSAKQQRPWEAVRLNIAVFDYDRAGKGSQLFWQPPWGRGAVSKYPGSGTFVKTENRPQIKLIK